MAVNLLDDSKTREVKDSELGIPDGDPKTIYVIRSITKDKYREFTKKHTKKFVNKRTHRHDEEIDHPSLQDDLLDYALVAWRGIVFPGEKDDAPCTRENKALLDTVRTSAILDAAGIGGVEEAPAQKKDSFRESAPVV